VVAKTKAVFIDVKSVYSQEAINEKQLNLWRL